MTGAASVAAVLLIVPMAALLGRAPWGRLPDLLDDPTVREAAVISLITSGSAAAISVVIGLPLAWVLARRRFRGRALLRTLVTLPMVLPPVVAGVSLLQAFGRRGLLGPALETAGVRLPFSTAGAIVAATFVAMPFFVVSVEGALRTQGGALEEAAATLGAGPWRRASVIVLPSIRPSIAAGTALAWARALGEFGATITFAGNLPGETQTMPLAVFVELQGRPDTAIALSVLLMSVAVVVLIGARRVGGSWT